MTVSAAALPLDDVPGRPGDDPDQTRPWGPFEPWWDDLPEDLGGLGLRDLPPDPLAGFERELTDPGCAFEQPPGGSLAMLLESLDLDSMSDVDLADAAGAVAREASWLAALEIAINDRLADRATSWLRAGPVPLAPESGLPIGPERVAACEVAAAQNISEGFARMKVELAVALRRLPLTRIALAAGKIDLGKARAIVEAVAVLDDDAAAEVEARVMERAAGQTLAGLRRSLRRAVTAADPAAAEARRVERVLGREVVHYPVEDGMGRVVWNGPLEQTEAFWVWLTAAADAAKFPGDTRTLAQRRSDVLADIAANGLDRSLTHTGADLPVRHGRRPHVSVVVAASTLLGLDDEPGELEGAGPITAELARLIASDGTWQRLLTDPATGRMLELSEDCYEPSQELRDHVIARDRYCRWPGCRMPANRCDLDHAIPHPVGPTDAKNLQPLHRSHHVVKTHTDMAVTIEDDGTTVWTFPSGRIYRLPPTRVLEHPDLDPKTLRDALRALTDDSAIWPPPATTCRSGMSMTSVTHATLALLTSRIGSREPRHAVPEPGTHRTPRRTRPTPTRTRLPARTRPIPTRTRRPFRRSDRHEQTTTYRPSEEDWTTCSSSRPLQDDRSISEAPRWSARCSYRLHRRSATPTLSSATFCMAP